MSDNELGLFLRTRREAVTPAQVGLPAGPRRRTPGLRRAELATLAGVSVEYVTRLEQGRDRHPSPPVLSALADALRLSPAERVHLHRLSKSVDSGFTCMGDAQPLREVRPTVRAILDRLEPAPAVVVNRLTEVLAYTDGYHRLMAPTGLFDGPHTPANLARFVFCLPGAQNLYADWEHVADETVATLKQGPFRADPHIAALADELTVTVGPAFADRVDTVPSLAAATGINRLVHPEAGSLRLAYELLELSADDDQRVIVYLPADDATAAALDALNGRRPGGLHAVSG
ncbi:helix-turn-helix transcriptional regulator [Nocardia abscessus]|uniref:helix-turn-helix transcriptional regulator n=1 Tax=Nocardia abscessus TaxID=120957 RepID=UPI0024579F04|nr:helix-turn-helix transcriptional regulator [Nocardia abscessus]